jgi:predicted Rossmann fold nucleotide-binding protein DprA/Smf involved in DNA uptake
MLLRLGATPITSSTELLESLGFDSKLNLKPSTTNYYDCSLEEKKVIALLAEPTPRDELIQALGLSASQANVLLSMMEIKGLIKENMGEIHLA